MKKLTLLAAGVALALIGFIAILYFLPCGNCCGHEQRCEREWKDGNGRMHKEIRVEIRDGEGMEHGRHGGMHEGMDMRGGCCDGDMKDGPGGPMDMPGGDGKMDHGPGGPMDMPGGDGKMDRGPGGPMDMPGGDGKVDRGPGGPMMEGGMRGCCCCCCRMHGGMQHGMMNDSMKMDTSRVKMKMRGKF